MAEIPGGIQRYQADDFRQFTLTATISRPTTVSYALYDPNGSALSINSISSVNSGVFVSESAAPIIGNSSGLYHIEYVVPSTVGFYTSEWKAFNSASQAGVIRQEFEIIRTEPRSFFSYGNVADVLRTARVLFRQHDITAREMQDYMEPADNRIDGILGLALTIPIVPTPPILRDCSKALTLWGFYSDRFAEVKKEAPPGIKAHYDECIKFMSAVASGNAVLATDSGMSQLALTMGSTNEGYKPIFDLRDFSDMRVDPERIDAEFDEDEDL